jgi:Protein of unknown function (DUF3891)
MLLREEGDRVLAIGQASHAWISGQLARAWGNERFPAPFPYEEVCLAAEQHDVGMSTWDLDPARDPESGLPYSFMEMPLPVHLELWSAAPARLLTQSRLAAVLVSMHGSRLYRRRKLDELPDEQAAAVRHYLDAQEQFRERLSADFDERELEIASQLIWTWDFLSLAICLDWSGRVAREVPAIDGAVDIQIMSAGERRIRLEPWPFEGDAMTVRCEARRLEGRYETDEALRAALSSASWETLELELLAISA